jgi:hypothetical protein
MQIQQTTVAFYKDGQTKEIKDIELYRWICYSKFRNVDVNEQGSDKTGDFRC